MGLHEAVLGIVAASDIWEEKWVPAEGSKVSRSWTSPEEEIFGESLEVCEVGPDLTEGSNLQPGTGPDPEDVEAHVSCTHNAI